MSGPIRQGAAARTTAEISIAVLGKEGYQTPQLKPEQKALIKNALETVRQMAEAKGLLKEGETVELTAAGIMVYRNGKWRNLLENRGISKQTKREVVKTLKSVMTIIGDLSKTAQKASELEVTWASPQELQQLKKNAVVVEMRVKPIADHLIDASADEEQFVAAIDTALQAIENRDWVASLREDGFSDDRIDGIKERLATLYQIAERVHHAQSELSESWEALDAGTVNTYAGRMQALYPHYCDALRALMPDVTALQELYGTDKAENPFALGLEERIGVHAETTARLTEYADQYLRGEVNLRDPRENMTLFLKAAVGANDNFRNYQAFVDFAQNKIGVLLEKEKVFRRDVDIALNFGDLSDKSTLAKLSEQSAQMITLLQFTKELIDEGHIREGMQLYTKGLRQISKDYEAALSDLVIPQQVEAGRGHPEFILDLSSRLKEPAQFLAEMFFKRAELPVTDAQSRPVFGDEDWAKESADRLSALTAFEKLEKIPAEAFKFVKGIQDTIDVQRKMTRELGSFVKTFKENRALFEAMMREAGNTDLATAAVFSWMEGAHQAMEELQTHLQEVADLSNKRKYPEAMDRFAEVMESNFPAYIDAMRPITLVSSRLADLQEPIDEFLTLVGMKSDERVAVGQRLQSLNTVIPHLVARYITASEKIPLAEGEEKKASWLGTKELAITGLEAMNAFPTRFEALFGRDDDFKQLLRHIDDNDWKKMLANSGWTQSVADQFTEISNRLGALIEPIRRLEFGIESEQNPEKKRALRGQLGRLVESQIPQFIRLRDAYQQLGGKGQLDKLATLAEQYQRGAPGKEQKHAEEFAELLPLVLDAKFSDRFAYFYSIANDCDLYTPIEPGQAAAGLLSGAQFQDSAKKASWLVRLDKHGWIEGNVAKLCRLHDAMQKEMAPLRLAASRLAKDPDNLLLQNEMRKVREKHGSRLNQIYREMQTLKGKEKNLTAAFHKLELACAAQFREATKSPGDEAMKRAMNDSVELLQELQEDFKWLRSLDKLVAKPMSWDTNFGIEGINACKLKEADKRILRKLYVTLINLLAPLHRMQRELEMTPENNQLRRRLHRELEKSRPKLNKLFSQFHAFSNLPSPIRTELLAEKERTFRQIEKLFLTSV